MHLACLSVLMTTRAQPGGPQYERTADPKTRTRPCPQKHGKKPHYLLYYISIRLHSYWNPRVPLPTYPMILLFIQGLLVLADLATLICGCP